MLICQDTIPIGKRVETVHRGSLIPCVGSWDRFHVYTSTKLKSYYSFKNCCSVPKWVLQEQTSDFHKVHLGRQGVPTVFEIYQTVSQNLGRKGFARKNFFTRRVYKCSLCYSWRFPQHPWLAKAYKNDTKNLKQRHFNQKICSVLLVTENCYEILQGKWNNLYKKKQLQKPECDTDNLKLEICYLDLPFAA